LVTATGYPSGAVVPTDEELRSEHISQQKGRRNWQGKADDQGTDGSRGPLIERYFRNSREEGSTGECVRRDDYHYAVPITTIVFEKVEQHRNFSTIVRTR